MLFDVIKISQFGAFSWFYPLSGVDAAYMTWIGGWGPVGGGCARPRVMSTPRQARTPAESSRHWSPASRDPRFSRSTPDALIHRLDKAEHGAARLRPAQRLVGEQDHIARQAGRRAVTSPTRKKWILLLEAKAVAAEEAAAAKKPRCIDSPAPSTLTMARQDTAVLLPQPFPRFVGGSPAVVFDP